MRLGRRYGNSRARNLLICAAKKAASESGYHLSRQPGRGLSNIWSASTSQGVRRISLRTSKDRWIAYPPLEQGSRWKTLSDVDLVLVATVDDLEDPKYLEVFMLDAREVEHCFNASYQERVKQGHVVRDNFGMWINLDKDTRGIAASIGSGLVTTKKALGRYAITDLLAEVASENDEEEGIGNDSEEMGSNSPEFDSDALVADSGTLKHSTATVGEIIDEAKRRIAAIVGVPSHAIRLDLKIEC